jgi:hypothetical protein
MQQTHSNQPGYAKCPAILHSNVTMQSEEKKLEKNCSSICGKSITRRGAINTFE